MAVSVKTHWQLGTWIATLFLLGIPVVGCDTRPVPSTATNPTEPESTRSIPANPVQSITTMGSDDTATELIGGRGNNLSNFSPQELWQRVLDRYQHVEHYSDQAEWNLQYRMDGQLFVETQTLQLHFAREQRRWSANAFRTQVDRCQDHVFIQIRETATNNLDGQVKVIDQSQMVQLFQDPIARLYLSGATDFPLARHQADWPALFFPQLSWLDPQLTGSSKLQTSTWDAAGSGVFRGRNCQIIQTRVPSGHLELWIDPQQNEIVRLFLPTRLLDPRLLSTPAISDLRLSLDFSQQDWKATPSLPEPRFSNQHKLVQQFVKVPESFPSPWIGKPSPAIHWNLTNNQPWKLEQFAGREVAALFLPAEEPVEPWLQICRQLKSDREWDSVELLLVPVAADQLSQQWKKTPQQADISVVADGIHAWNQLGLTLQPNLVVWDGHGMVQFVGRLSPENAIPTTTSCLRRLKQGESIALEMTSEYQNFYQQYLQRIEEVSVPNLPSRFQKPATSLAKFPVDDTRAPLSDLEQFSPQTVELDSLQPVTGAALQPQWSVAATMPQQIQWIEFDGQSQLLVLEGYRTIARYSTEGQRLSAQELDLPDRLGIQSFLWDREPEKLIGYQRGGKIVYVFSPDGKLLQHHVFDQPIIELHRRQQQGKTTGYWLVQNEQITALNKTNWEVEQRWSIPEIKQFQPQDSSEDLAGLGIVLTNDHLLVAIHPKGLANTRSAMDTFPGFLDATIANGDQELKILLHRQGLRPWWVWTGRETPRPLPLDWNNSQNPVRLLFAENMIIAWNRQQAALLSDFDAKPQLLDAGTSISDVAIRRNSDRGFCVSLCSESEIRTFAITETVSQKPVVDLR